MKYIILILILVCASLDAQEHKNEEHHDELKISLSLFDEVGISFTTMKYIAPENPIKVYGEVIPTNNGYSHVGTLLSGRIGEIHVKLGQKVKKGAILFELSSLQVMELVDNYFTRQADLKRAEKNFHRIQKLRKEGIGSEKAFFEAQADYEKSKAEYESSDRNIHAVGFTDDELNTFAESKKHDTANMNVKAPISGIITELSVKKGQFVSGEEILAEILDPSILWARLHVYEKDIEKIQTGLTVEIRSLKNNSEKTFGSIISFSRSFMKGKKSIEVIVSLNEAKHFVLGSSVNAEIYGNPDKKMWVLPSESVINEHGEYYVFIRKSDDEFEKKSVIIGKMVGDYIQILNGLKKEDSVVEKGSFYLKSLSKGEEIGGHDD